MSKLTALTDLVRRHELYWSALAQQAPTDLFRTFMVSRWDPFYRAFSLTRAQITRHTPSEQVAAFVDHAARTLSSLRELAAYNYITVPDIGSVGPQVAGAPSVGHHFGGAGGFHGGGGFHGFHHGGGYGGGWRGPGVAYYDMAPWGGWDEYAPYIVEQPVYFVEPLPQGTIDPAQQPAVSGDGVPKKRAIVKIIVTPDQKLCVRFCVGGKCYDGCADMAGVFGALGSAITDVHAAMHAKAEAAAVAGCHVVGHLATCAGAPLVGGWWDDVTGAVTGAVKKAAGAVSSAVTSTVNTVGHTISKFKGPLLAAASTAAVTAATAAGGPIGGLVASQVAPALVNSVAGDSGQKVAAQQTLAAAAKAAQSDPTIAKAVALAHDAVAKGTAAYHAVDQVAQAADGSETAAANLMQLVQSAAAGDPSAAQTMDLTQGALQSLFGVDSSVAVSGLALPVWALPAMLGFGGGYLYGSGRVNVNVLAPPHVSGVVGAAPATNDPRALARTAAAQMPGRVIGVVQRSDGSWGLEQFASSDAADDWYGQWLNLPRAYLYVGYFDKAYGEGAQNEQLSPHYAQLAAAHGGTAVSGWPALALALGAGAAGVYYGPRAYRWGRGKFDAWRASHAGKAA